MMGAELHTPQYGAVWKQDDTTLCVFYDPNEGQGEKGLVSNKISAEHRE